VAVEPVQVSQEAFSALTSKPITKTHYSDIYKTAHWWKMANTMDTVERGYNKALKTWLYTQRSRVLRVVAENMKGLQDLEGEVLAAEYWDEQLATLKKVSSKYFTLAMQSSGDDLLALFRDLHIAIKPDWTIYDTNAVAKVKDRVNQGKLGEITDTLREQLQGTIRDGMEGGWTEQEMSDAIRDRYNIAQNRAQAIARTELGGVINDSRIEGFKSVGFGMHSWLSARDGSVRETPFNHAIDGETVQIGETFSNGLRWPNDEQGEAGNVINCRCITLPEEDEAKAVKHEEPEPKEVAVPGNGKEQDINLHLTVAQPPAGLCRGCRKCSLPPPRDSRRRPNVRRVT
jgi:SPP1 gp7 family putative phage head morphogenesis protein